MQTNAYAKSEWRLASKRLSDKLTKSCVEAARRLKEKTIVESVSETIILFTHLDPAGSDDRPRLTPLRPPPLFPPHSLPLVPSTSLPPRPATFIPFPHTTHTPVWRE